MEIKDTFRQRNESPFLSLKWRALLLLSMVLLVINSSFYYYHSSALEDNFGSTRNLVFERNKTQIQALINQSGNHLEQLAELIPSMYNMKFSRHDKNYRDLLQAFDKHWSNLQIQSDVDAAGFFDLKGNIIRTWGDSALQDSSINKKVTLLLKSTIEREAVSFHIFCVNSCRLYVFVPIVSDGIPWGGVILGRSLAEPILNFSIVQSIEVGILSNQISTSHASNGIHNELDNWQMRVMALSNYPNIYPVLQDIQQNVRVDNLFDHGQVHFLDKKAYEINIHQLKGSEGVILVFIEDITHSLRALKQESSDIAFTGIVSVLLSELALLMILWTPLSNLVKTTKILPLLASSKFEQTRHAVQSILQKTRLKNEITVLNDAIVDLSYQLQNLEDNVQERSSALALKINELTHQRDFVNHLLNSAQVAIVTHDGDGRILLVNKQTEVISGYSEGEILTKSFSEFVEHGQNQQNLQSFLQKVAKGDLLRYRNESTLLSKQGGERIIAWLHSHLDAKVPGNAEVLSVGLDITERKAYEKEISWLADHDSLTGLHNRRRFNEILKKSLSVANRYRHDVALLFLDMDNFKHINDTLGHKTGDLLIKSVADCLQLILRESDYISRLGGDEFAIILTHSGGEDAIDVATKINKHLFSLRLPMVDSNHRTTASIGISLFPEHAENAEDLLANADLAMYQAKAKGRGCWHMFSKKDLVKERIETQLFWRYKIIDALSEDKFELHYQPIMNLSEDNISHYEVLLRMRDEHGQLLLPTPFIEVAEKAGLIHDIDHMVLAKSIREIEKQNASNNYMNLAVNLSAHSFSDNELLSLLKQLLNTSSIQPSQLIFEITETAALSDLGGAARLINQIRDMGCRFALDDFGVGFSSFYYLKELPVDFVKIDGSFIQKLPQNRNDQILVKAMADIAREFGKKTIAEYVEDEETLRMLREYQVDFAQGFHIGKPALKAA